MLIIELSNFRVLDVILDIENWIRKGNRKYNFRSKIDVGILIELCSLN